MSPVVLIAIIVGLPIVLLTLMRVNAVTVFLSLCLGSVLVEFMGSDTLSFINTFFPHASSMSENTIEIGILLVPAVLTTIFMFHSIRKIKVVLNVLPAITVGLLLFIVLQPLLSAGLQSSIVHSVAGRVLNNAQSLIVGGSGLLNLAFLWIDRRGHAKKEHKGKHS